MYVKYNTILDDLKKLPLNYKVVYAINTCWWNVPNYTDIWYSIPVMNGHKLPCDPRGSMLMEGELGKFLSIAEKNPKYYGKHELNAFMAAFHGNLLTDDGKPTSLEGWDKYNELIDQMEGK